MYVYSGYTHVHDCISAVLEDHSVPYCTHRCAISENNALIIEGHVHVHSHQGAIVVDIALTSVQYLNI